MDSQISESPVLEQEICVKCGLCCDGTLFDNAVLQIGEDGNLPEKIQQQYGRNGDYEYFKLPCAYFQGTCTIYDQKRAFVCSAFRCQLLADFSKDSISQANAIRKIENTLKFRDEIYQSYRQLFGQDYTLSFRKMLIDLDERQSTMPSDDPLYGSIEFLRIKCTIFETLLIKNFKSLKNFEQMIINTSE